MAGTRVRELGERVREELGWGIELAAGQGRRIRVAGRD